MKVLQTLYAPSAENYAAKFFQRNMESCTEAQAILIKRRRASYSEIFNKERASEKQVPDVPRLRDQTCPPALPCVSTFNKSRIFREQ